LAAQAASLAYGSPVEPYYKLDEAQVIVSLDCDFIGSEENAARTSGASPRAAILDGKDDPMSRLYAVESLFTLTGAQRRPSFARAAEHDRGGAGPLGAEHPWLVPAWMRS
jgi:hypothetical protein